MGHDTAHGSVLDQAAGTRPYTDAAGGSHPLRAQSRTLEVRNRRSTVLGAHGVRRNGGIVAERSGEHDLGWTRIHVVRAGQVGRNAPRVKDGPRCVLESRLVHMRDHVP